MVNSFIFIYFFCHLIIHVYVYLFFDWMMYSFIQECAHECTKFVCFLFPQLPIKTGLQTTQSMQNVKQNKECLVNVSRHKFSLVINGLTKTLQSVLQTVSTLYVYMYILQLFTGHIYCIFLVYVYHLYVLPS